MRFHGSLLGLSVALSLAAAASCRAQYAAMPRPSEPPVVRSRLSDDALVAASFRVLLDQIIGDSADRVCVSVADPAVDAPHTPDDAVDRDPSEAVLRRLRGSAVIVMARSVCAADERNFGPSRGHLRLTSVTVDPDGTLTIDADTMGDHFARYRCSAILVDGRARDARCRLTSRD
jgi:hypothetical protein